MNKRIRAKKQKMEAKRRKEYEEAYLRSETRIYDEMQRTVEGFGWPRKTLIYTTTDEWDAIYDFTKRRMKLRGKEVLECPSWFIYANHK